MIRAFVLALLLGSPAASPAQDACHALAFGVAFCPAHTPFDGAAPRRGDGPVVYSAGGVALILEAAPLSVTAATDPARIRPILDDYLAGLRGFEASLPVMRADRLAVDGRAAERVVYRGPAAGRVYADTVALGDGFALYVQTVEERPDFTAEHDRLHRRALAAIRLPRSVPAIQPRSRP